MGARKRLRAEKIKAENKTKIFASLKDNPTSPRKMRLVADLVRGNEVNSALDVLAFAPQEAARKLRKLVLSAISNWEKKNDGVRIEDANLYIKEIAVDSARVLKRLRPAPQGRGYRVRKRSNHVTVILDSKKQNISE